MTLEINNEVYEVIVTRYACDNSLAVILQDGEGDSYYLSQNLSAYFGNIPQNTFFIDHDAISYCFDMVDAFVKRFCDTEHCAPVSFGPFETKTFLVKIIDEELLKEVK